MLAVVPSRTDPTRLLVPQAFKHAFFQFEAVEDFVRGLIRRDGASVSAAASAVLAIGGAALLTGGVPAPALFLIVVAVAILSMLTVMILKDDGQLDAVIEAVLSPPPIGAARFEQERVRQPLDAPAAPETDARRPTLPQGARRVVSERAAMRFQAAKRAATPSRLSAEALAAATSAVNQGLRTIAPQTAAP